MNEDRINYSVEVHRVDQQYDSLIVMEEVDDLDGVARAIRDFEEEGRLDHPNQIRVNKRVSLDAPLTDEEEAELDAWVEELGEATDGSDEGGLAPMAPEVERQA